MIFFQYFPHESDPYIFFFSPPLGQASRLFQLPKLDFNLLGFVPFQTLFTGREPSNFLEQLPYPFAPGRVEVKSPNLFLHSARRLVR